MPVEVSIAVYTVPEALKRNILKYENYIQVLELFEIYLRRFGNFVITIIRTYLTIFGFVMIAQL